MHRVGARIPYGRNARLLDDAVEGQQLCNGALPICWAELVYFILLQVFLDSSFASASHLVVRVLIGCIAAQAGNCLTLLVFEHLSLCGLVHSPWCRQLQAVFAAVAWVSQFDICMLALATALTFCLPECMLWCPMKRPAAAHQGVAGSGASAKRTRKSPTADATIDTPAPPGGTPPLMGRHSEAYWCVTWQRRGAGPSFKQIQSTLSKDNFQSLCTLDKAACKQLLVGFDSSELRRRLANSPYKKEQGRTRCRWQVLRGCRHLGG